MYNVRTGDMAELVECARLEIAYTGNCIEGSNPPISAIQIKKPQWGCFLFERKIWSVENALATTLHGFGTSAQSARSERGPRNKVEWELQSPYLRHNKNLKNSPCADFFGFIGADRGMCANAVQHTIRR